MRAFLNSAYGREHVLTVTRAAAVVSVLVVLATFLVASLLVRAALGNLNHRQADIRQARVNRALLFGLQLDEETAIRGYAATGDRRFLEPYVRGRSEWNSLSAKVTDQIIAVEPSLLSLLAEERGINARWNEVVAFPIAADPAVGRHIDIEMHGKRLIDAFRVADAHLIAALTDESSKLDLQATVLVGRILAISLGLGLLVSLLVGIVAAFLIATLNEMRTQRQAYEDEKRVTGILQGAFTQKALPKLSGVALDAVYKPATNEARVGGDWYDAIELPEGPVLFSIGDVVGHGVQSAVDMSRVRQAIVAIGVSERDPGKVLTAVNHVLECQSPTFVTAICGYIDLESRIVRYASAGHPVPLLAHSDGATSQLHVGGSPLGAVASASYASFEVRAAIGDLLVFYTDGAIEYDRNIENGERRLRSIVSDVARRKTSAPARLIYRRIFRNSTPADDVAILTVRFMLKGAPARVSTAGVIRSQTRGTGSEAVLRYARNP